jgi:hypothetical protein
MTEEQITLAVAAKMFPSIDWETPEKGYLPCPGLHLHTSSDGRRDCRITVNDGMVPTIFCCHNSCSGVVAEVNHQFRSAIGKMKTTTAGQLGKIKQFAPSHVPKAAQPPMAAIKKEQRAIELETLPQPIKNGQALHLETCFQSNELICIVFAGGPEGKPVGRGTTQPPLPLAMDHELGTFIRVNPMAENGASDREVTAYRHCLIECDEAALQLQWSALVASNLPISVAVSSGGRSIHGWVKVDGTDEKQFRERAKIAADTMEEFEGIKVDRATLNPSRLSRLAGCARGDARQELLAVNIGAQSWDEWISQRKPDQIEETPIAAELAKSQFFYRKRSKDFLQWTAENTVLPLSDSSCRMMMRREKHVEGTDKTAMDEAICNVILKNSLDYDGPLPGYRLGVHKEGGNLYFCDSEPEWLQGTPLSDAIMGKGWETIFGLIKGLFVQGENWKQLGHFLATLKQSRDCLKLALQGYGKNRQVRSGQATVLCGPKACGKSFILRKVIGPILGGRIQDAHKAFSSGSEGFNGELLGGEVWVVDDKEHASDIRTRKQFGSSIKSMLYGATPSFHAKHKTQITVQAFARLFILCNDQDDAIKVLPPLTPDIEDKIHLFRCGYAMPAMATESNNDWKIYGDQIESELPAFAGWLDQHQIPAKLLDSRSGVSCYQDSYVVALLASQSPEYNVAQLIVHALERGILRNHGHITSRMILDDLRNDEGTQHQARNLLHDDPALLGRYLGRIHDDSKRYQTQMGLLITRHSGPRDVVEWQLHLTDCGVKG